MGLYIEFGKYYCEHRECPYRYCPWYRKGVRTDKIDFSLYEDERYRQNWFQLPKDNNDAENCMAYMDI